MTITEQILDGPHGPLRVRLYPANGDTAIVWAHGGGFAYGDIDMDEADAVARAFAERGFPTASVDYRLASAIPGDRWPAAGEPRGIRAPVPAEEVAFVVGWARSLASRVAVGGASAGGNIAVGATLSLIGAGSAPPDRVILAYPTLHAAQPPTPPALAARIAERGLADQFSPAVVRDMYANYLGGSEPTVVAVPGTAGPDDLAGFPPTTIVASETDELQVSGAAFAGSLANAGVDVSFAVIPGTTHGHLNRPEDGGFEESIAALAAGLGA
ncbi:alpha/beta hydrolase fold domain-containing protein [Microbacterium indicum]|uniref:alpha/beta hydrolase fold domain-containing protein n=1 Tax=Microbacterium indicum TaxID=358100 RepID=UPI0004178991|nr:alpha/beta hydrolase fold domain-containing protein [Microbacterium indicum]